MTSDAPPPNPYPGLRPFEPDEAELFFGRERETDELRRRLRTTRLLAVVGSSGTGKSSLVRCGLIPSLHGGFMAGAGTSWRVAVTRPGEDPIGRLAEALDGSSVLSSAERRATPLEVALRHSRLGLADAVRQARLPEGANVLVVVDQFEELFRFRRSRTARGGGDDAEAFVRLLIEAARREDVPVFVAITMRSEFVGECVAFDGLPEAINAGQYLVPRLSRDALRAAITGPAAGRCASIAPRLVTRLLNEVGDDPDRLPVLQHALMRTWDAWAGDHAPDEPLDIRHYDAIGTMAEALSRHADEAYAELATPGERRIAERLFKTLTETTEDGHGLRRPTAAERLAEVCGTDLPTLERVVDRFRAPGRAFLQPPAGAALQPRDVVDISHESLMRVWRRLSAWVREEARAVEIYRRLTRSAGQHASGEAGLWRPPELTLGLRWLRETRPTAAWAGDEVALEQALGFLRRSRQAHRRRIAFAAAGAALLVALAIGWVYARYAREREENLRLRQQVEALEAATSSARTAGQAQSEEVKDLRARQAVLRADVDRLQQARGKLEAQVEKQRQANRELEADLQRLAAEKERLEERQGALDGEFGRLTRELALLAPRTRQLESAVPVLEAQAATLQAQVDALSERKRELERLRRETLPCSTASLKRELPETDVSLGSEGLAGAAGPRWEPYIPPDPGSSDALRRQIDALTRDLARLLEERARLRDEAGFLQRENAVLDRQRDLLRQENERISGELQALATRGRALGVAVGMAEEERNALAADVEAAGRRNREKADEVEAARTRHLELDDAALGHASRIGVLQEEAEQLRADIARIASVMAGHVDRLLRAARGPQQPADLAALLAVKAWRWAPYDPDDPAHPAVYNTLWQMLNRLDPAGARRLIAPAETEAGKLATTRAEVMAGALCERVPRPLTEAEWRRFAPERACFTPEAARPCER
jgi:hypothetical protein